MSADCHIGKPKRLETIFQNYDPPLYFITTNTAHIRSKSGATSRLQILARREVHDAFREYGLANAGHGRAIGRYVIMPDHLHFFVRLGPESRLSTFVRLLKQYISLRLKALSQTEAYYWQPGFFDHILRHAENYREKWEYVAQNPVRAGLVEQAEDWPYQGEIVRLQM